jgi:hypothetical protein
VPCGREPGHVDTDLGDDDRGRDRSDTGDLIKPRDRRGERDQVRLDLSIEHGDVGVDPVDSGQHPPQQEPVVVVEVSGERLLELRDLHAHPGPRHVREHSGVAFSGDQGSHHLPPGDPEDVRGDHRQLDAGVLQQLLDPVLFSAVRTLTRSIRYRVRSRNCRIDRGGTKLGRSIWRSATLHNHTASRTSDFGRPGRCLTSRALTNHGSSPCASSR